MSFYDEVQVIRGRYPEGSRSAVLPALRLAQEERGWLSPDAIREVADALDLTPGYCHAVASFYDMYHLAPVGEHLVEVCTNLSCALVGAQRVVDAFEQELGVFGFVEMLVFVALLGGGFVYAWKSGALDW